MIQGLDNVGLAVSGLDRMLDFYMTTLGFTAERGENDAWLTLGSLTIYLFVTHPRGNTHAERNADLYTDPPGLDHLALRVASIEQASADLEAKGIRFVGEIVGEPGEFRYRGFADPEGNMLYLVERPA
jgi:catechol 2,3-dioxygenase-like lactoylglutathione lyase family enzyme